jgi:hypothetical protein
VRQAEGLDDQPRRRAVDDPHPLHGETGPGGVDAHVGRRGVAHEARAAGLAVYGHDTPGGLHARRQLLIRLRLHHRVVALRGARRSVGELGVEHVEGHQAAGPRAVPEATRRRRRRHLRAEDELAVVELQRASPESRMP